MNLVFACIICLIFTAMSSVPATAGRLMGAPSMAKTGSSQTSLPPARSSASNPASSPVSTFLPRPVFRPGELLIRYSKEAVIHRLALTHEKIGSRITGHNRRLKVQKIRLKKGMDEETAATLYLDSGLVDIAEKHVVRYPNRIPGDPLFSDQWGMSRIDAPGAWDITAGAPEITVAVIDTGIDYRHPDLAANIRTNSVELNGQPGIDDDRNGFVDDVRGWDFAGVSAYDGEDDDNDPTDTFGHGTHVAGIIAGKGDNALGIAGVCWNIGIMPLKITADNDQTNIMDVFDIVAALDYARENGARIINCSFGSTGYSDIEQAAFADLKTSGIPVVCAAGNEGTDMSLYSYRVYPASYELDNIISVTASDMNDDPTGFSSFGIESVDVAAPGTGITSTSLSNGYEPMDGTSMAAAHVSGIVAMILSINPDTDYRAVKSIIIDTVDPVSSWSGKLVSEGRVNAFNAVTKMLTPVAGDLNHDRVVEIEDAVLALRIISLSGLSTGINAEGDIDGDGKIGAAEAVYVLQKISGFR